MRTRPILLFTTALLFAACGRRNNLLLGRVESPLGSHTVAVTDCYRLSAPGPEQDRKSTRLNSSHLGISHAAFCWKKMHAGVEGHVAIVKHLPLGLVQGARVRR